MAKGIRPRNYRFFEKFTYYVPGVGGMFVLLALLLVGALIGNIIAMPFMLGLGPEKGALIGQFVAYPLMFIPAMIFASVQSRNNSFTVSGLQLDNRHFSPVGGALCAALVVVATLALSFCSDAILSWMPEMPAWLENALEGLTTGDNLWMNFLMVSIFAPFFEEWLCRGMVLRGLLGNKIKPGWAIVISALFFAFIHLNPWQAVPAFLLGCLFGYVYYKTGSLRLTMLMHFANNSFALLMSNLNGFEDIETWKDIFPGARYWTIFAACLLLLALIVRAFERIPQEREKGNLDEVPSLFEQED